MTTLDPLRRWGRGDLEQIGGLSARSWPPWVGGTHHLSPGLVVVRAYGYTLILWVTDMPHVYDWLPSVLVTHSVLGARACEHLGTRAGAERGDRVQESSLEMRSRPGQAVTKPGFM